MGSTNYIKHSKRNLVQNERINRIVKAMAKQDNTNEQLKETNQLLWVGLMNNYKHSAEEIVYIEIVFS